MHFHFTCAAEKKIFTCLCYLYVFQAMLYSQYKFINNNIICNRVRKEIIMLKKAERVFHSFMENPLTCLRII